MRNRLISLMLAMVMLFSVIPVGTVAAETVETENDVTIAEYSVALAEESDGDATEDPCAHTETVTDPAVAATCTESGWTEGTHCAACREILTAQEVVPALGHDWDNATCTTAKTCKVCGTVEGDPQHSWADATCEDPKTCSVCGLTEGEALGHDWEDATCTKDETCANCGATASAALGHTWADADCETARICSVCNAVEDEARGHDYVEGVCAECGAEDPAYDAMAMTADNEPSTGVIVLDWKAVEGAAAYNVYCADAEDGTYTCLETTTETDLEDPTAELGETCYYYVVAATNDGIELERSHVVYGTRTLEQPVVTASNVASSGKPKLTWEAVEGAEKYTIYRAAEKDGEYASVYTTETTSYTNTNAEAGVTYYYKVKAIAAEEAANSDCSEIVQRTCDLAQPVVTVTNVEASGKVQLTWEAVDGAVKYRVYRALEKDGEYKNVYTTAGTTYTNTSAEVGVKYYYKVKAVAEKEAANSAESPIKSRTCNLAQPEVTVTNDALTGKPKLTWKAVDGAVKYRVYRAAEENGTYKNVNTTDGTEYINKAAELGVTYYYKVKAIAENADANSAESPILSKICILPAPQIVASNVVSSGKPKLDWEAIDGAVKYRVYRATEKNGEYKNVYTTEGTTYTNTSAEIGVTYYYKVKAVAENESASAVSVVKQRTCNLKQPVISGMPGSTGKPRITWEAVEGAVTYKIYRATSENGTYKLMYSTDGTGYTNTTAENGKTYYYKVKAVAENTSADSALSAVISTYAVNNVYQYTYSSFSTSKSSSYARQTNLRLACKAINGTILAPGEEFSFNGVVGTRSPSKGYMAAPILGGSGSGYGGGVCQVATTLFNATLKGNLKITKRRPHSSAPSYVPRGRDAAIYKKIKDFRFVNDSDYYIKIKAYASGGYVKFTLLTRESGVSPSSKVKLWVNYSGGTYTLKRSYQGKVNYSVKSTY